MNHIYGFVKTGFKSKCKKENRMMLSEIDCEKLSLEEFVNKTNSTCHLINSVKGLIHIIKMLENDSDKQGPFQFLSIEHAHRFPFAIWFRGEPKSRTPLTPSVFRKEKVNKEKKYYIYNERGMMWDLQRRISEYREIDNPFERLCMAQHYLVPTRILDWTENPLIALYFAVSEEKKRNDGKFFILNPLTLNDLNGWKDGKNRLHDSTDYGTLFRSEMAFVRSQKEWAIRLNLKYKEFDWERHSEDLKSENLNWENGQQSIWFSNPVAVVQPWSQPRMRLQASVCTLHGGWLNYSVGKIPRTGILNKRIYMEFTIKSGIKQDIRRELLSLGIHKGSVFPEIDKQREYFTVMWKEKLQ